MSWFAMFGIFTWVWALVAWEIYWVRRYWSKEDGPERFLFLVIAPIIAVNAVGIIAMLALLLCAPFIELFFDLGYFSTLPIGNG
ncbi:MAG: hypothetical protein Q7S96_04985 [bacterium]|nr:hypothetical protein [bacterium]